MFSLIRILVPKKYRLNPEVVTSFYAVPTQAKFPFKWMKLCLYKRLYVWLRWLVGEAWGQEGHVPSPLTGPSPQLMPPVVSVGAHEPCPCRHHWLLWVLASTVPTTATGFCGSPPRLKKHQSSMLRASNFAADLMPEGIKVKDEFLAPSKLMEVGFSRVRISPLEFLWKERKDECYNYRGWRSLYLGRQIFCYCKKFFSATVASM